MSLLLKILNQTELTFGRGSQICMQNLSALLRLVDSLKLSDLVADPTIFQPQPKSAPCTFVSICEREKFTISIFIIKANYKMPLHDHENMKGILKVINGKIKIQSYTKCPSTEEPENLTVIASEPKIFNESSPASFLDERTNNFHELSALDGTAAFFDILAPPYFSGSDSDSGSRNCHFFRKLAVDDKMKIFRLEEINCPSHYFCDTLKFEAPVFLTN